VRPQQQKLNLISKDDTKAKAVPNISLMIDFVKETD
jgi:hypothetical protein